MVPKNYYCIEGLLFVLSLDDNYLGHAVFNCLIIQIYNTHLICGELMVHEISWTSAHNHVTLIFLDSLNDEITPLTLDAFNTLVRLHVVINMF